jgi:hypothetical protein
MFFRFLKTIATTVLFAGLHKEWTRDVTTQANRIPVLRNDNAMALSCTGDGPVGVSSLFGFAF